MRESTAFLFKNACTQKGVARLARVEWEWRAGGVGKSTEINENGYLLPYKLAPRLDCGSQVPCVDVVVCVVFVGHGGQRGLCGLGEVRARAGVLVQVAWICQVRQPSPFLPYMS